MEENPNEEFISITFQQFENMRNEIVRLRSIVIELDGEHLLNDCIFPPHFKRNKDAQFLIVKEFTFGNNNSNVKI